MNGEPVPASWMSALGPGFKCSKASARRVAQPSSRAHDRAARRAA